MLTQRVRQNSKNAKIYIKIMNKFTLSICAVMLLFSSCSRAHTEDEYGEDGMPTTKNIEAHIRSNEQGSYEFYENGINTKPLFLLITIEDFWALSMTLTVRLEI